LLTARCQIRGKAGALRPVLSLPCSALDVQRNRASDELLERGLVDTVILIQIDGAPRAFEMGVE
jgi:hypothetical protein